MPSTASKALPFLLVATLESYGAYRLWPGVRVGSLVRAAMAFSLAWAALATGWVSLAYALERPALFFKSTPFRGLLLPFTLASAAIARIANRLGVRERSEVAPGLWVGGWPHASSETWSQVDCTATVSTSAFLKAFPGPRGRPDFKNAPKQIRPDCLQVPSKT